MLVQPVHAALMNSSVIMASASTSHGGVMKIQIVLTVLMRTKLSAVSFQYLSLSDFLVKTYLYRHLGHLVGVFDSSSLCIVC